MMKLSKKKVYVIFNGSGVGARIFINKTPAKYLDYLVNPDLTMVKHIPPHLWTKKHFEKKSYKKLLIVTSIVLVATILILLFK